MLVIKAEEMKNKIPNTEAYAEAVKVAWNESNINKIPIQVYQDKKGDLKKIVIYEKDTTKQNKAKEALRNLEIKEKHKKKNSDIEKRISALEKEVFNN